MTILSLAHLSMIEATPLELIDAAVAGGFQGVGLRINSATLPGNIDLVKDRAALAEVKRRLKETGLSVPDVEAFALAADTDPRRYEAALDTAAELGAGRLLCIGADPDYARLLDNFVLFCELARARGIVVGLEFIPYLVIKTLGMARELIARAQRPNTGILLDVLHLSRSGGKPEDLSDMRADDYAFVQLCDARAKRPAYDDLPFEARNDRFVPGEGELWLDRLMPMLPRDRHLSVEAPVLATAGRSFAERARYLGEGTRRFLARHDWL